MVEGGAQTCALNAADEIAVAAFLDGRLPFPGIAQVIEQVLDRMPRSKSCTRIEDVLGSGFGKARRLAKEEVERLGVRAPALR